MVLLLKMLFQQRRKRKINKIGSSEKNEGPVTEEVFDAIPIEQQLQNIDGLNQNEDVTNIKKIEKQQTDTVIETVFKKL